MYASPFIDETFDINNCENYILTIQCALDGFSFSILDTTIGKFIVLADYEINSATPFELKNKIASIVESEPILQKSYKEVKICFITDKLTIVPEALIGNEKHELFNFSFDLSRDDEIISSHSVAENVLLSAIPKIIKDQFKALFNNCKYFTSANPIFNYSKNYSSTHQLFFVTKFNHTFQIIVLNQGKIEFLNTFFVKNEVDCLYYLLNTAKKLNADAKSEIILSGKIEPKSTLTSTLKSYFEKVNMAHFSNKYAVSYTFFKESENYHLPLIELALCE